ncbi:LysM peptidoglycan-binding domain-containing protein [Salisaeta longa]|uniref:LysM peptidoglycan-binding domain-containing protein n=1 Tax=Salisaeta longa TaxID=503170 RepID=UPI0003B503B0|nr:LysM peptidoglycan-binding domain-containing protein [Salisaeta longa]
MPIKPFIIVIALGSVLWGCQNSPQQDAPSPNRPVASTPAAAARAPADEPLAVTPTGTVAAHVRNAIRATKVRKALLRYEALRPYNFEASVSGGHLTLRGDVPTRALHRKALQAARTVDGIERITNAVTIQGRSAEMVRAATAADPAAQSSAYYTVQTGDTLWSIARQYSASVRELKQLNNLDSGSIRPGQRIRVR